MNFSPSLPHGEFSEVFKDVFFVTGTMISEFFGSTWQFSRNMIVVREKNDLTIINSVRLNDKGMNALEALGKVKKVVRIGDMHGLDDGFYVDKYQAEYWALPNMGHAETSSPVLKNPKLLNENGPFPLNDCSLFVFSTTKRPEAILRLDREGGIMIACDALQNWEKPDEFFDQATIEKMQPMNFFVHAGVGPAWIHGSEPKPEDFRRLNQVQFRHALCGHGTPVKNTAQQDFANTFKRMFGVEFEQQRAG